MAQDSDKGSRRVLTIDIGPLQVAKGSGMVGIIFLLHHCAQVCADLLRTVQ
jgi:hypothetical protein